MADGRTDGRVNAVIYAYTRITITACGALYCGAAVSGAAWRGGRVLIERPSFRTLVPHTAGLPSTTAAAALSLYTSVCLGAPTFNHPRSPFQTSADHPRRLSSPVPTAARISPTPREGIAELYTFNRARSDDGFVNVCKIS